VYAYVSSGYVARYTFATATKISIIASRNAESPRYNPAYHGILALDDGTLVVGWNRALNDGPAQIRTYLPDGTQLLSQNFDDTYAGVPVQRVIEELCVATDRTSFWVRFNTLGEEWGGAKPNYSNFVRVRASDLAVLDSFVVPYYDGGGGPLTITPSSAVAFGPSTLGGMFAMPLGVGANWVDVPNFKREWIDASQFPGGAAWCLCMLWATEAGVNVQARLVSLLADGVTVDAVVGTSADITSTDPTDATFAVTLTGNKRHKLQLTSSTPLTDLWCAPGAKVVT
jgi:hypothetical protein